jgi:hypothetical protein
MMTVWGTVHAELSQSSFFDPDLYTELHEAMLDRFVETHPVSSEASGSAKRTGLRAALRSVLSGSKDKQQDPDEMGIDKEFRQVVAYARELKRFTELEKQRRALGTGAGGSETGSGAGATTEGTAELRRAWHQSLVNLWDI